MNLSTLATDLLPALSPTLLPMADSSWLSTFIGWFHDPEGLLLAMGPWVLWGTLAIVLIESGVLFPVLPGDSLLFTAGLLHDRLGLHLPTLVILTFVAAFIGAQIGYWLGARYGRRLFSDDARFLKTEHLHKAESYFLNYGGRALVIGRFIPFVHDHLSIIILAIVFVSLIPMIVEFILHRSHKDQAEPAVDALDAGTLPQE